jgi:arginine decarboxylase
MATVIEESMETFGIENWGQGYFGVSRDGNLIVHPVEGDSRAADVKQIIDDLARRGYRTPVLLRFPQIIANQVKKLYRAFQNSIGEFGYKGQHMAVYPM